jgi:rod shape determining protein RodA
MRNKGLFENIDWVLVGLYFLMVFLGWLSIYAAAYQPDHSSILDMSQEYGKQLMWIGTSVILIIFILLMTGKIFSNYSSIIYGGAILSLILVLIIGKQVGGAKSWFGLGPFSIQPSEFAKFATLLALGSFLSTPHLDLRKLRNQIVAGLIIGAPVFLILLQPDAGSAIVYSSLIFALHREGLPSSYLLIGFSSVALFLMGLLFPFKISALVITVAVGLAFYFANKRKRRKRWFFYPIIGLIAMGFSVSVDFIYSNILEAHHRNRIDIILGKIEDNSGAGYNLYQSKIAIGSGGFSGKGFLEGTQTKFNFVPEQSTDFIFCTVGEEWGFLGSLLIVGLFLGLILRIIYIAERQRSVFSRVYGYGVAGIIFIHFFINIGMAVGLLPVIGIPLPFFSYGGSSLWGFTVLLFIFIQLDSYRKDIL